MAVDGMDGRRRAEQPMSRQSDSALVWRMGRLMRDGTAEPISRNHFFRRERGQQGENIFPAQLTTSRIGNHTYRLMSNLPLYVMTIISRYILVPVPVRMMP